MSTHIAETSLTVDGILYIIDTGYVKMKVRAGGAETDSAARNRIWVCFPKKGHARRTGSVKSAAL